MSEIEVVIWPRKSVKWAEFLKLTPANSIALDGVVNDVGPCWDEPSLHLNFDHHSCCEREATMSTAMQVFFAIKGGLFNRLSRPVKVYINDPDQDTSLAVWLLLKHKLFEGVQSHPNISRLLALTDRLDITGGAFPMSLDEQLIRQHAWVFGHYSDVRKSGELAVAGESGIRNTLEATLRNLDRFFTGQAEERELDTRHQILYKSPKVTVVDEIGGNDVRYLLFSQNQLEGYLSIVARRPDGRTVFTIGRKNRYVDYPLIDIYPALTAAEPKFNNVQPKWGGSNTVGGSDREFGSGHSWESARDVVESVVR